MSNAKSARAIASAILLALGLGANAQDLSQEVEFNIPPKSLSAAIIEFSQQTGVQIVTAGEDVSAVATQGVSGRLTISDALQKLLSGTELKFRAIGESTVALVNHSAQRTQVRDDDDFRFTRVAEANVSNEPERQSQTKSDEGARAARIELEEVVVPGSHIRGAQNLSSPVITFDRADIEASGYATTQQFVQKLPQNLNNISETTFGAVNGGETPSVGGGAALNLRGLGGSSTLVLLNGRRLASAGVGNYVDISLIPLSAIEQIEVLTDGASAIYGSDAIGGVVNLSLRKQFEGAETRVRYGTVTEGNHDEFQASQAFGHSWQSGQLLVSYDHYRRSRLDSTDRSFTPLDGDTTSLDLVPEQRRNGVFATVSQRLSERMELSSDLFYGERESDFVYGLAGLDLDIMSVSEVKQYGGSLNLIADMNRDWLLRASGTFDRNRTISGLEPIKVDPYDYEAQVWSGSVTADGPLATLPGGEMRLAIGGQYRDEQFVDRDPILATELERDIAAVFAELRVPLVGPQNARTGLQRLELTFAGRYEEYSDFGSSFNPKVGLAWGAANGVNVRGTWGTSFKAPLLYQMNPADFRPYVYDGLFADTSGDTTAIVLVGSGVDLGPEESTNWTAGFDFEPSVMPELKFSATYFDIDFQDRIRDPFQTGYNFLEVLLDPSYAFLVERNPGPADVNALLAHPRRYCFCAGPLPTGDVTAIVDRRLTNLAGVHMSGVDVSVSYGWESRIGDWGLQLSGTQLLKYRERTTPGAAEINQMNTVWQPVDLRLRESLSFTHGELAATVFVNYVDGYRDRRVFAAGDARQRSTVASWTTVDLNIQLGIDSGLSRNLFEKTVLTFTATNLFDRDPPYVGSISGLYFDGVNANPEGRFVGAQLTARW